MDGCMAQWWGSIYCNQTKPQSPSRKTIAIRRHHHHHPTHCRRSFSSEAATAAVVAATRIIKHHSSFIHFRRERATRHTDPLFSQSPRLVLLGTFTIYIGIGIKQHHKQHLRFNPSQSLSNIPLVHLSFTRDLFHSPSSTSGGCCSCCCR